MLDVVGTPFCSVVRFEAWDAPAGRHFAAYTTRGGFRALAGHPVIDEFATLSSPILVGPRVLLGKLYDAGISLGHRRDPEMGLDLGWPPLCIGLDLSVPPLPPDWQERLLAAASQPFDPTRPPGEGVDRHQWRYASWSVERLDVAQATILATTAPLLPRQLSRMCERVDSEVVVAVATGNRLVRIPAGDSRPVHSVSETDLEGIVATLRGKVQ